jgi:hypothetical protein
MPPPIFGLPAEVEGRFVDDDKKGAEIGGAVVGAVGKPGITSAFQTFSIILPNTIHKSKAHF